LVDHLRFIEFDISFFDNYSVSRNNFVGSIDTRKDNCIDSNEIYIRSFEI